MELRKKILSYFLLATYLIVVLHQGVHQCNFLDADELPPCAHQQDSFSEIQQDDEFHIDILHFLNHLFEDAQHADSHSDIACVSAPNSIVKKDLNSTLKLSFPREETQWQRLITADKPLRAPPFYLALKKQFILFNTPLRAPPALV